MLNFEISSNEIDWTAKDIEKPVSEYSKYLNYEQSGDSKVENRDYHEALNKYKKASEGYLINEELRSKLSNIKISKLKTEFRKENEIPLQMMNEVPHLKNESNLDVLAFSSSILISTCLLVLQKIFKFKVKGR